MILSLYDLLLVTTACVHVTRLMQSTLNKPVHSLCFSKKAHLNKKKKSFEKNEGYTCRHMEIK